MAIICLTLDICLPACRSLKEKRSRLRGLRDKFGRNAAVALSETDFHNRHDYAQWSLVAIGSDGGQVQAQLHRIETYIQEYIDGYITKAKMEHLA